MRIIMVPVADRPECAAALESAFSLADRLHANINACHIRPHRYSSVKLSAEANFRLPGKELPELSASDKKAAAASSAAAQALVRKLAAAQGLTFQKKLTGKSERCLIWSEQVGHVENLMPVIGPFADLIVVSRPKRASSHIARLFMEQALLYSSRPVLILPQARRLKLGRRIVIGWDQTQNAMRSVVAALPILQAAEEVSILTSGVGKPQGLKAGQLVNYLKTWGIPASSKRTRQTHSDEVADLDEHIEAANADLLIMGSYSRHRFRERLFGGVTEHYLNKSTVPVLMTSS